MVLYIEIRTRKGYLEEEEKIVEKDRNPTRTLYKVEKNVKAFAVCGRCFARHVSVLDRVHEKLVVACDGRGSVSRGKARLK